MFFRIGSFCQYASTDENFHKYSVWILGALAGIGQAKKMNDLQPRSESRQVTLPPPLTCDRLIQRTDNVRMVTKMAVPAAAARRANRGSFATSGVRAISTLRRNSRRADTTSGNSPPPSCRSHSSASWPTVCIYRAPRNSNSLIRHAESDVC